MTENSDASSKKIEIRIEKINYDTAETSSKNLKVSRKSSMRATSDSTLRTSKWSAKGLVSRDF